MDMARWVSRRRGDGTYRQSGMEQGRPSLAEAGSREKALPISVRVKWRGARRDSEGVIVPEAEDNITSASPKFRAREGPLLGSALPFRR